jgi:secreted PhoX family phosphatase
MTDWQRRRFIKQGLVAAGGLGLGLANWSCVGRPTEPPVVHPGLGPLLPVNDQTTGIPLVCLPKGFRYHSMAWAGQPLGDGYPGPGACDGMGIVDERGGVITLIRNHELKGSDGPFGDSKKAWDVTGGGASTLKFDTASERLVDSWISLNGTLNNCAGGVTPWGTWLSCEEGPVTPELMHLGGDSRQILWGIEKARKSHGFVFEVRAEGESDPQPILDMGQFYHEAVAFDPKTGIAYMTEDVEPQAGFYRFTPHTRGQLHAGGKLEMLRVKGVGDLTRSMPLNQPVAVEWVRIADPMMGHTPGTHDGAGVVAQGIEAGGTAFVSLEGCAYHEGDIYFTSKAGGAAGAGQVFRLGLENQSLQCIYEAGHKGGFSGPDNIVVNSRGSLVICEDRIGSPKSGQYVAGLGQDGNLYGICQVNPALRGMYGGHALRDTALDSEWAGACFSADGEWMFVNIYNPGVTLAITGPWAI